VRELRHAIEHALLLCEGQQIEPAHLPPEIGSEPQTAKDASPSAPSLRNEMEALERRRIVDALNQCGGNQTRAAELLGMPRRTLTDKLTQYGIPRPRRG
jgi:DNA-binding NtrC family response regulator